MAFDDKTTASTLFRAVGAFGRKIIIQIEDIKRFYTYFSAASTINGA